MRPYAVTNNQEIQIHASGAKGVSYCAIAIALISVTQLRGESLASPPLSETSFYAAGGDTAGVAVPEVNGLTILRSATWPLATKPHQVSVTPVSLPAFTDDPLVAGITIIKAIHLSEVRDAVNMMRARAGLVAATWTDAAASSLTVKAVHVTELRNALTPALTALMRSATYTDPNLAPGNIIKALHIQEIRDYTKNPAALTVSITGSGVGTVLCAVNGGANGTCAASYNFGSSVMITALASTGSAFTGWTGCDRTSANTCTVGMTVNKTVTAAFTLMQETLTITRTGTGTGTVQCVVGTGTPGACAPSYAYNTQVAIKARPNNGSGTIFGGFGGACSGIVHDCTVTMTSPLSVTVSFVATPYNVVFVSSQLYPSNLGGARAYDTQCNQLATAAGINTGGSAFVAWMSDDISDAYLMVGAARGFIRLDGAYISDLPTDIYQRGRIMNPIDLDETGQLQSGLPVYTGTGTNGANVATSNCSNWTGGTGYVAGITSGGPYAWTAAYVGASCAGRQWPIYCFKKDRVTPLAPVSLPTGAKRIYLLRSPTFVSGGGITNADTQCNMAGNKGPLTGTFKALLSTSSTSAATHALLPGASYYTTDSLAPQLIGTGSQIAGGVVNTGIWAGSNGSYSLQGINAWTGSTTPGVAGTGVSTCNDWNAMSGNGAIHGWADTLIEGSNGAAFWSWSTLPCTASLGLYCVEQ